MPHNLKVPELKWIADSGKKFRVITSDDDEYIVMLMDYVWPDDNEECGGCEAIIVDTEDGDFFQLNVDEIKSIEIIEWRRKDAPPRKFAFPLEEN